MGGEKDKKKKSSSSSKKSKKKVKKVVVEEESEEEQQIVEKSEEEEQPVSSDEQSDTKKSKSDDEQDDEEESLDEDEKKQVEEDAKSKKKSVVSKSMGLSAHNPARGSIMLKAQHSGSLMNPNPVRASNDSASPALDRRGLKLKRRGTASESDFVKPDASVTESQPKTPRFATAEERSVDLAKRAGLMALVKLRDSKKKYTQKNADAAVLGLYQTDSNTVGVEPSGFQGLFKLAQSKKPNVQCTALWSLVTILGIAFSGEDDITQRRFMDEGGLKIALSLLESSHHEVPMAAAALLGNVVLFEESRDKLIKKGGLEKLMDVATPDNLSLARTVLVAVANLSAEEDNVKAVRAAGGIDWLLKMAQVEDLEARQAAVAGIANIANSKFQDELMDSDVLGLLKPLLASKAPIMLRGAAQAVSNLALIEENRAAIMKKVLPEIVKLSESKDVRVQHCCAVALNNLAQDDTARQKIIDAGGESAVKKLMFSVDEDVRSESELLFKALTADQKPPEKESNKKSNARMDRVSSKRFVLGIFEQYKTQRKEGVEIDPIEVLLHKLADYLNGILPTPDVVVSTIKNVETQASKNPKNDRILREMAGIQMLVSMIPEFETHIQIVNQTLSTLHVLVRLNPRNILAVADVEIATEEFLKCLQQPGVSLLDVINLIGALADVERTRNEIVTRDGISMLVRLLREPNTPIDVQGSTLEVLAKLAIEKTETQFAIEQQALPTIFELLQSAQSSDVQCQLLRLLSALAFNNRHLQDVIRKEGKVEQIIGFTRSPNYLIQEYSVRALLAFVANDHKNKEQARKFGAIPALTHMLSSDTESVLKSAVRGISELSLSNAKNKTEFRKAGTIPALVDLIDTSNADADAAAAADAADREMAEMIDCTLTTYVLECIAVLCSATSSNQSAFAATKGALSKLEQVLDSTDLREVYHAINCVGAICKNNKKVKKQLLAEGPYTIQKLEKLAVYKEPQMAALAAPVLKLLK